MKFLEAVKIRLSGCAVCSSVIYTLPYTLNSDIAKYFKSFGKLVYNLNATRLLRINCKNDFKIEGTIGTKTIKLIMPKEFKNIEADKIPIRVEFEKKLASWLTDALNISIVR